MKRRNNSPLQFYHVIVVGINRSDLFFSDEDRKTFLFKLSELTFDTSFEIHCFSLMNNHLHLLIRAEPEEEMSKKMGAVKKWYVWYVNKKYRREGTLYNGKFYSKPIESKKHLKAAIKYILKNPLAITDDIWNYRWSSIKAHYNQNEYSEWLKIDIVKSLFYDERHFVNYINLRFDNDLDDYIKSLALSERKGSNARSNPSMNAEKGKIVRLIQKEFNIHNPKSLEHTIKKEAAALVCMKMPYMPKKWVGEILGVTGKTISKWIM